MAGAVCHHFASSSVAKLATLVKCSTSDLNSAPKRINLRDSTGRRGLRLDGTLGSSKGCRNQPRWEVRSSLQSSGTGAANIALTMLRNQDEFVVPEKISENLPFEYKNHPSAAAISKHMVDWMRKHDFDSLYESGETWMTYINFHVEHLVLPFFPDAAVKKAVFICMLNLTFFQLDDIMDASTDGANPETAVPHFLELHLVMLWSFPKDLLPIVKKILNFLDHLPEQRKQTEDQILKIAAEAELLPGTEYPYKLSPLGCAFREVWMMPVRESRTEYCLRFAQEVQNCGLAMLDQTVNRFEDNFPTFDEYMNIRFHAWGLCLFMAGICDYMTDTCMPNHIYYSPDVQKMLRCATVLQQWTNDIYSCPKEVRKNDPNNGVIVLSHELNCSCTEAASIIVNEKMVKVSNEMKELSIKLEKETPPEHLKCVQEWNKACFYSTASTLVFMQRSSRYAPEHFDYTRYIPVKV